jgi:acetolactate synthase-1/2/3 large subunit
MEARLEFDPERAKIVRLSPPAPAAAAIEAAAGRLESARRIAILVGGGAAGAASEIMALAEMLEAPVMSTVNGRGIVPPGHPLNCDFAVAYDDGRRLLDEADAVIAIGTEIGETDYEFWATGPLAPKGAFVRIDIDPRQIAIGPRVDVGIVADAGLGAAALRMALGKGKAKRDRAWADRLVKASAKLMERTREIEDPLYDRMLSAIRDRLGDPVLVGDSTKPVYRGMLNYRAPVPRSFFSAATGFGTLGFALPAAIGAKVGLPDRHVIAVLGDGGMQFTLPELMSAKEARAGISVVVWNNDGYREIKDFMVSKEIKPIAVDISPPDFLKTAAAAGIEGTRCRSIAELTAGLAEHGARATAPRLFEIGPWMKD